MKRRLLALVALALTFTCCVQTAHAQYGTVQVQLGGYGPGFNSGQFSYGNSYGNGYYGVYNNGYGNVYYNGYGQSTYYQNSYPQGYGYYRQSRVVYPSAYNYSGYSYRTYPGMGYGYGRVRYYSSFR